jgi:MFS transporter, DHA1 family, multidrug resistance protein
LAGLCSVVAYCYLAAAPLISASFLHLNPAQYGLWNLVNIAGMFASGLFAAKLIKHYSMKNIIQYSMIGLLLSVSSLLLMWYLHTPSAAWFFTSTMLLYFFGGIIFPCASFYAMHAIEDTASASSMMSFINMSSATLCVVILGHLPFSFLLDFIIMLAGFAILVILLGFMWDLKKQPAEVD